MEPGYPTFRDVRDLARQLWTQAGEPTAEEVGPEDFWFQAEEMITPAIVLAIAKELLSSDITRRPGDSFYPDYYHNIATQQQSEDLPIQGNSRPFATGALNSNGIYRVRGRKSSTTKYFDLNQEQELTNLIEYLKSLKNIT